MTMIHTKPFPSRGAGPTRVGTLTLAFTAGVFLAVSVATLAGEDASTQPSDPRDESQKPPSFVNPETARLERFVGTWNVVETHFNSLGETVSTVKGTEEITWILDHRAIRRIYRTSTESKAFRAVGTLTWNAMEQKYHGSWFDNVSTSGPQTVKGAWEEETRTMVFNVESSGKNGTTVRHKVVERFVDEETRVATTYSVDASQVVKLLEVQYKRTVPCPDKTLTIIGG